MAVVEATPQRAVFHWINVTGERRLRFNYRVNLRFDRANASPVVAVSSKGNVEGRGGNRGGCVAARLGTKWIGKMGRVKSL